MKELMGARGDCAANVAGSDRRGIVLRHSAAVSAPDVEKKRIVGVGGAAHELRFVGDDLGQPVGKLRAIPVLAIYHYVDRRRDSWELKFLKRAKFDGTVHERCVIRRGERRLAANLVRCSTQSRGRLPFRG